MVCGGGLGVTGASSGACNAAESGRGALGGGTRTVALRSALQEMPNKAVAMTNVQPRLTPVNQFIKKRKLARQGA